MLTMVTLPPMASLDMHRMMAENLLGLVPEDQDWDHPQTRTNTQTNNTQTDRRRL